MDFIEYPISQSLIRKLFWKGEERLVCPHRLYNTDILKIVDEEPSDPMIKGRYFETKCLGKSAYGQTQDDLPRNKVNGQKTADHKRIDEQVMRFTQRCLQKQINVIKNGNVQVPLLVRWGKDEALLSMNLDIFPTTFLKDKLKAAIIDLKLTADLDSTYGEYCYGTPELLDDIQGKMYHYGVRNIEFDLNPDLESLIPEAIFKIIERNDIIFLLWVFNYKKQKLADKFIEITWNKTKEAEFNQQIKMTIALLEMFESMKWPKNPKYKICKNCPIIDCDKRIHEDYESI